MLAAVTLLMVLSSASAASVHPSTTLTAPYKGTVSSPNAYSSYSGCASAKTLAPTKWSATSGLITGSMASKANTCAKALGSVGSSSYADLSGGMSVAIPIRVASTGSHSISTSWSVNLATTQAYAYSTCPPFNVHYPPALYQYEYAYCEAGADVTIEVSASVQDLNNASWYGNYSYAYSYNDSYFENYTDCYNYGTPTCYNTTGTHSYGGSFGYHNAGVLALSGSSSVMLWSNGTNMVRSHHYVLVISVYLSVDAFAEGYNLLGHFTGSGNAAINAATLGNGVKLGSVVIT